MVSMTELPEAVCTLCHDCLFNSISRVSELNDAAEVSFQIFTENHEYVFNFEPDEGTGLGAGIYNGPATEDLLRELLDDGDDNFA